MEKLTLPIKDFNTLLTDIENNETVYGIRFLDRSDKLIAEYFNAIDPTDKDRSSIEKLITELTKAKSDWDFTRAYGKNIGMGLPKPEDRINIGAIEFCFFQKSMEDITKNKPYQWYRIIDENLILRSFDLEDSKCLLELFGATDSCVVKKIPTKNSGSPDYLIRKKLFLHLDLNRKASCSEVVLTLERCYDGSTEKTKKHFEGFDV